MNVRASAWKQEPVTDGHQICNRDQVRIRWHYQRHGPSHIPNRNGNHAPARMNGVFAIYEMCIAYDPDDGQGHRFLLGHERAARDVRHLLRHAKAAQGPCVQAACPSLSNASTRSGHFQSQGLSRTTGLELHAVADALLVEPLGQSTSASLSQRHSGVHGIHRPRDA